MVPTRVRIAWSVGAALAALVVADAAGSAPIPFVGRLSIAIGSLPLVSVSGSGIGSTGPGGAASIPAGIFPLGETAALPTPLLGLVYGVAMAAPGQNGKAAPFASGSNGALLFDGSTGTMGLNASAYLLNVGNRALTAIPLGIVGVGGTQTFTLLGGLLAGTIFANPYQLGRVTVSGGVGLGGDSTAHAWRATGFDNRTAAGIGVLQLVSPTTIRLQGGGQDLGSFAMLSVVGIGGADGTVPEFPIVPVPEPVTALLLGAGLLGLAAVTRARS
jgi:hypothetical protein